MSKRLPLLTLAAGLMLMTGLASAEGTTERERIGSPAENTERNVRDEDDESLSVNAHNAKVITRNGRVSLRGPVDSAAEKTRLQAIAQQTPGVSQVDNQLEVKAK
jgi:hyperosmotically inducible periplasmic protein